MRKLYDYKGEELNTMDVFMQNMTVEFKVHSATNTKYSIIRVFQTKTDGTKQYPFVLCPNGTSPRTQSTLTMNKIRHFPLAINAGIFDVDGKYDAERYNSPMGTVIENGAIIQDNYNLFKALTINSNGALGCSNKNDSGQELINNGIKSAVFGYYNSALLIENFEIVTFNDDTKLRAQRQAIGQFNNGDYAIITCEGRNFDNSPGLTVPELQEIGQGIGLKFLYLLDGGGSTQTVIGEKQLNTIYELSEGRQVPTYIVFNGTDTFKSSL